MIKIMNELKRQQIMRRIEQQDVDEQPVQAIPERGTGFQPVENMARHVLSGDEGMAMPQDQASPSQRDEAATQSNSLSQSETATRPAEKQVDLKKQSVRQAKLVRFSRF